MCPEILSTRVRKRVRAAALDRRPSPAAWGDPLARLTLARGGVAPSDRRLPRPTGPTLKSTPAPSTTAHSGTPASATPALDGMASLPISPCEDFLRRVGTESRVDPLGNEIACPRILRILSRVSRNPWGPSSRSDSVRKNLTAPGDPGTFFALQAIQHTQMPRSIQSPTVRQPKGS